MSGRSGRKRKQGPREPNGRIKRDNYALPSFDRGSDWVQARRARFGEHYSTALGRAFAAGLLGELPLSQDRYQGGKRFVRLYQTIIGGEAYRCPLNDAPRGGSDHEPGITQHDHDWLFKVMDAMDVAGVRPYFDQLISRATTDHGPHWLDALLDGGRHPVDRVLLNAAINALDILAPPRRPLGIISQQY